MLGVAPLSGKITARTLQLDGKDSGKVAAASRVSWGVLGFKNTALAVLSAATVGTISPPADETDIVGGIVGALSSVV